MAQNEQSNVWFGVAMLLIGLVIGIILTAAFGIALGFGSNRFAGGTGGAANSSAPAPVVSIEERMLAIVDTIGVDGEKFSTCVAAKTYDAKIQKEQTEGQKAGVQGTPGNIVYSVKAKKGYLIPGAQPMENFQKLIDAVMQNAKSPTLDPSVEAAGDVVPVDKTVDHILGNPDADIALIVYTDYQCPYCRRVHPTLEALKDTYGDKIMVVYRHFPLGFHPDAMPYARGAECANEIGGNEAFWAFTHAVMNAAE